jgi:hypothetical protein
MLQAINTSEPHVAEAAQTEACILTALQHPGYPNIVQLLRSFSGSNRASKPVHVLVLEHLGRSLRDVLQQAQLKVKQSQKVCTSGSGTLMVLPTSSSTWGSHQTVQGDAQQQQHQLSGLEIEDVRDLARDLMTGVAWAHR